MIRKSPFKHWDMIPDIIKPYFIKKVCIYGSDSCGKSTLTIDLAKHYKTAYVPELARNLIEWGDLNIDNLALSHLEQFAKIQYETVMSTRHFANKVLFCDSDNITTQIYSDVYCGAVTEKIKEYEYTDYDLYLLLYYDTPYIEEGQRNLGHRREEMFNRFKLELDKRNISYVLIKGNWQERFEQAVDAVNKLLE
jgi:HTH-type transcriptional repressor of NAD biosynthesis genes